MCVYVCLCSVGSVDVMFVYLSIYLYVVKKCSLNCIGGFFSIFFCFRYFCSFFSDCERNIQWIGTHNLTRYCATIGKSEHCMNMGSSSGMRESLLASESAIWNKCVVFHTRKRSLVSKYLKQSKENKAARKKMNRELKSSNKVLWLRFISKIFFFIIHVAVSKTLHK